MKYTQMIQQGGHTLGVDDVPPWHEQFVKILNHSHSAAEAVAIALDALNILHQDICHLLISDMQREDYDQSNGVTLLTSLKERSLSEPTKIIMPSAYSTKAQMHTAICSQSATDFLSKEDVHTASSKQVGVDLTIFWVDIEVEQAVHHLQIENQRVDQDEMLKKQVTAELDELLRRLFSNAESLIVGPLTSTPSRSGMGVLSVQPFYTTGSGQAVVVKFGYVKRAKMEEHHFKDYVQPFVSGTRHTTIESTACTPLLGGIVYSLLPQYPQTEWKDGEMLPPTLLETTTHNWLDFGQFYRRNTIQKITSALHRLFHETCGFWYANQGCLLPRDLTMDYCRQFGKSVEQLENTIKGTLPSITISHDHLSFPDLTRNRLFTNPFQAIRGRTFIYPTYESITHGDLNQNNILVDNTLGMWLIDFESTERSHVLRDFATLDAVIRFQLLSAEEATLDERLAMEEALLDIAHFSQLERLLSAFKTKNPALEKAYQATCYLRMLARWAIDRNPHDHMNEYYVALLYNALFTLQFFSLSTRQREHAFLSASLLVDKLTKAERISPLADNRYVGKQGLTAGVW
jgi:CheY-like chemotaxis protein